MNDPLMESDDDHVIHLSDQPQSSDIEKYNRLRARHEELLRRQEQLEETGVALIRRPNWPKYFPIVYADVDADIPPAAKKAVRLALICIPVVFVQAFVNLLASVTLSGLPKYERVKSSIFSIIFALVTCYVYVSVCFTKLYQGCETHNLAFSFIVMQFVIIGWTVYLLVGFPNSGSAGLALFIDLIAKSRSAWSKTIVGMNILLLVASLVLHIIVLQQAQQYQKVSGVPDHLQPMVSNAAESEAQSRLDPMD